jgi:uncharacterized protein (DUF1501 family)
VALAPTIPNFLGHAARASQPERDGRVLVVLQLDGGNDGINTVVPFRDEGYARHRVALRLPAGRLIKVDDRIALHPGLADAAKLLDDGRLAIVQGVGYPNPNRSHFQSMAIWQTARPGAEHSEDLGWLGRSLDGSQGSSSVAASTFIGPGVLPIALRGRRSVATTLLERPEDLVLNARADPRAAGVPLAGPHDELADFVRRSALDAYASADRVARAARVEKASVRYPDTKLGQRLRVTSGLLKAGFGARVYYLTQPGYDTHATQLPLHAALLEELSGALKAFLDDLSASGLAERVLVLGFSEFGRRVAENGSAGTDHGTAGPVFLAGPGVKAGLVGNTPTLTDLDTEGDLKSSVDFRRIYATVLEGWLGLSSEKALGGSFEPLPLLGI